VSPVHPGAQITVRGRDYFDYHYSDECGGTHIEPLLVKTSEPIEARDSWPTHDLIMRLKPLVAEDLLTRHWDH